MARPASWPSGVTPPPPRARTMAMGVDLLVLLVIYILGQIVGGVAVDQAYPKQTHRIDVLTTQIDRLDNAKGKVQTKHDNTKSKATAKDLQKTIDADQKVIDRKVKERSDLYKDLVPVRLGTLLVSAAVAVLYLGIPSVRTGRTFGKHQFQIRVVRADGSPITWAEVGRRYGVPIFLGFGFSLFLGPPAFALVLIGILQWPRNPHLQGLHDRLARTIVVDG
jgi:hypothetical protein